MLNTYRISLSFTRLKDGDVPPFAKSILENMTNNASFPTPTVPLATVVAALADYEAKLAAAEDGTKRDTAEKDIAKRTLLVMLRQLASYVQSVASEDLSMLLSSGFQPVNPPSPPIELPKPVIAKVENNQSTQLQVRLNPVATARAYEIRINHGTAGWQSAGVFTQARKIVVKDLIPGTTYTIQARAIGGSTGASDWSDPVSHMSL